MSDPCTMKSRVWKCGPKREAVFGEGFTASSPGIGYCSVTNSRSSSRSKFWGMGGVGWGFLDCLVASLFLQRYECSIVNIEFCRVLHPDVASSEIILNLQHCTKSKCLWISKSFSLPFGLFVFICLFEPLHLDSFACMIEILLSCECVPTVDLLSKGAGE